MLEKYEVGNLFLIKPAFRKINLVKFLLYTFMLRRYLNFTAELYLDKKIYLNYHQRLFIKHTLNIEL